MVDSTALLTTLDSQSAPLRSFGDYELVEEIARGGMGIIYKARQKSLGRIVAVKMLLFGEHSGKDLAQRFRTEAAAAASLQHPNIVAIHEVGAHEGLPFFAMDFVEGPSLAALAAGQPLSAARAARYVKIVTEAIHYAHERGILHRDLKPSNVLIDPFDQPRVTDFGLAKLLHHDSELTLSGQVLGSPNYMPPEQAAAKRGLVGRRSDVYSLGAILYHLLTGRPPFVGETLTDTLHEVLNTEPVSPRLLNPSVPPDLETLCLKCLEKEPSRRYATAQTLAEDLNRFLRDEPIQARPVGHAKKLLRWCRRKPAIASLSVATIFLVLAVSIGSPIAAWRINRERQRATKGERDARQKAYASDMGLTQQALLQNNLGRANQLLNRQIPGVGQMDLRGWEWRYLWQSCQSDAVFTLCRKSNPIIALAVSPDGKWVAVGEYEKGGLSIWDLPTRREVLRLPAGDGRVRAAFSPRALLLAFSIEAGSTSTNSQYSIRLWDGVRRQNIAEMRLGGPCQGLAFSDDGQNLVTSTEPPDNQLTLWRIPEGTKLASYPAPKARDSSGTPLAATRDFTTTAYGAPEGRICAVDLSTGKERWSARGDDDHVKALAFSADGKTLISGSGYSDSSIVLRDITSGKESGRLDGHHGWVSALVSWPDGHTLASASADQTIRLWDLPSRRPLATLRGHQLEVWRLALLPDNRTLVSGCKDGSVCVWDTAVRRRPAARVTLPAMIAAWRFAPNNESVLTLNRQGHVARWKGTDFEQMELLLDIGTNFFSRWTVISPDGGLLAVGSIDQTVRVWDLHRRALLHEFTGPASPWPCEFLSEGKRLILLNRSDDSYHEWDLATLRQTRHWQGAAQISRYCTAAFSPNERWCVTIGSEDTILRDMATDRDTNPNLDIKSAMGATFSPDGKLLAAASSLGFARLWETTTLREVATIHGFLQGVHSVTFSPDGKRLATGSDGKEAIKLWDVESHQELLVLEGQGSAFLRSAFSPDGNILGSMSEAGVLHLWRAPSWTEIEAAEKASRKNNRKWRAPGIMPGS
jgi:eukaryotic-like serine/threonine-protein kinase